MTTRFDYTSERVIKALEASYNAGLLTSVEFQVLRDTFIDEVDELEEEAWNEIDNQEKTRDWMKSVLTGEES